MKAAGFVLLIASICAAQSPTISTQPGCMHYRPNEPHFPNVPECAPLKCGHFQHIVPEHLGCSDSTPMASGAAVFCDRIIPAQCEDDIHFVTEKEWQQLQERLKWLEDFAANCAKNPKCAVATRSTH